MLQINIRTVKHDKQRYDTIGDWQFYQTDKKAKRLFITVSHLKNEDYEFLVAIHELIEAFLCRKRGITDAEVTRFDEEFERRRSLHEFLSGVSEPGNHPDAPYHKEHLFAAKIECMIAEELGVNWTDYDKAVDEL